MAIGKLAVDQDTLNQKNIFIWKNIYICIKLYHFSNVIPTNKFITINLKQQNNESKKPG